MKYPIIKIVILCLFLFPCNKETNLGSSDIDINTLFLKGKYPPFTIEHHVLGSLVGIDRVIKKANLTPISELNRIIWHESHNDPTAKNPNSSAYGYCQMIKTTREWVARDIKKETGHIVDYENPDDQIKACIYLYENGIPKNEWLETMPLWKL